MASSAAPLHLYRRLLRAVRALPADQRSAAVREVRKSWHAHRVETDPIKVKDLFNKAQSTLGYIRMATPRRDWASAGLDKDIVADGGNEAGSDAGGTTTYIVQRGKVRDGRAVKVENAKHSTWNERNLDPDMVSKHHRNLERMHFGGRD